MRLLTLLLMACTGSEPAHPPEGSPRGGAEPSEADEEALNQLRALGYVEEAEEVADATQAGVQVLDAERVQPGYRLVVTAKDCVAELLRTDGEVVRTWRSPDNCYNWSNGELTEDGTFIVTVRDHRPFWDRPGPDEFPQKRVLLAFTFDGDVAWKAELPVHHDLHVAKDGALYPLITERRDLPELDAKFRSLDNGVARYDPRTRDLRSWSFYDMIAAAGELDSLQHVAAGMSEEGDRYVDVFHTNAVVIFEDPALAARDPFYGLGRALVTFRHQDAVMLFDLASGQRVWSWGRGELDGPHDGKLLPNGNLLIFDNGLSRGSSRVIELNPLTLEQVWSYGGAEKGEPDYFYTRGRGSAQRLPNGNTLIANSNEGEAFEVTPTGDVVWRYYNPRYGDRGHRAVIVRMKHYPAAWIEPLLQR
ncbi:MAG: PQQ-binding-like beta-propeller repeat protein [Alphaproteobacteria bacterium]|nr:PQQ-binding-like beta-propeller repeat protein [Alphaproteobacteria bacterium]